MNRLKKWIIGGLVGLAAIGAFNFFSVYQHAQEALKGTDDITVAAYHSYGVHPNSVVYDLWDVKAGASHAYILGRFFQFAEEMKDRDLNEVRLAYKGKTKFVLDGDDFQEIGRSFSWQNPVYVARTFPEKLKTPNGRPAYSTWTGGVIGVVGAQMKDINQMASDWYLDDIIASR